MFELICLRQAEFEIIYGEGVSAFNELIDLAVENEIISKAGAWYSFGEQRIGQGREAVKKWLYEQPDLQDKIREQVKGILGMGEVLEYEASDKEKAEAVEKEPAKEVKEAS